MNALPLKKAIYDKAKEIGVEQITLAFSGGSDEGHLSIYIEPSEAATHELFESIQDWAWDAYDYSGAGDGTDYGDNIVYDIKNRKVTTSEWFTIVQNGETAQDEIEVDDTEEEEE